MRHHALVAGTERAGVLLIADGALALIERVRDGEHYFVAPGGGIEPGETEEAAAVREAAEELGIVVRLLSKAGTVDVEARGRSRQHYWFAECDSTVFGPMTGPEVNDSGNTYRQVWIPVEALSSIDLRPPELRALVDGYLRRP